MAELLSVLRGEMLDTLNSATSTEIDRAQGNLDRARQLSEELQNLIEDQRLIAAQKSTVIAQIMDEMKEVETNFQNKVEKMSAAQLDRLSKTFNVSLTDITNTRKSVSEKIQGLCDMYVKQVEEEEERILRIIERRLEKALGFIEQAVKEE